MTMTLTICRTCSHASNRAFDDAGRTGGEVLFSHAARLAHSGVEVKGHDCLWACAHSCTALVRGKGRTGYLIGRLAPTEQDAAALLDWCEAVSRSAAGEVDYQDWPEGIKGHFIARIPACDGGD